MDYDKTEIATAYDMARTMPADRLQKWLDRFVALAPPGGVAEIVDLGCGTGRFSQALADLFRAHVVGIDPSDTMLAQARAKSPGLTFLRGAGENLPLEDACADLVFISLVYHHLSDPAQTARECRRVLRAGGRVMIRTPTTDADCYQMFTPFFPSYVRVAFQTIPSRANVRAAFGGAGFAEAAHETILHRIASDWDDFAAKQALRADSFLVRLPDSEFESGMTKLRAFAAAGEGSRDDLQQDVDLFVFAAP